MDRKKARKIAGMRQKPLKKEDKKADKRLREIDERNKNRRDKR